MKRSSAAQAAGGAHFAFFFVSEIATLSRAWRQARFKGMLLHIRKQQAIPHEQAARWAHNASDADCI